MENQLAQGIAVAVLIIVSGYVPYLAYKEITAISAVIEQYGSRNDMKLFTAHQIFKAHGGGIVFFFGCYMVAVGFASALFLEGWDCYFYIFLLVGGVIAGVGIVIIFCVFFGKKAFVELIKRQHVMTTEKYDENSKLKEKEVKKEQTLCDDKKQC